MNDIVVVESNDDDESNGDDFGDPSPNLSVQLFLNNK